MYVCTEKLCFPSNISKTGLCNPPGWPEESLLASIHSDSVKTFRQMILGLAVKLREYSHP